MCAATDESSPKPEDPQQGSDEVSLQRLNEAFAEMLGSDPGDLSAEGVLADVDIDGLGWGLGMAVVADEDATLTPDRTGDFWWSGYYGTTFLVSPGTGLTAVILTQNEPGEFTGLPYEVYVLHGLALAGI